MIEPLEPLAVDRVSAPLPLSRPVAEPPVVIEPPEAMLTPLVALAPLSTVATELVNCTLPLVVSSDTAPTKRLLALVRSMLPPAVKLAVPATSYTPAPETAPPATTVRLPP